MAVNSAQPVTRQAVFLPAKLYGVLPRAPPRMQFAGQWRKWGIRRVSRADRPNLHGSAAAGLLVDQAPARQSYIIQMRGNINITHRTIIDQRHDLITARFIENPL